jgi:very-short-patch-repair endonuclease
MPLRYNPKLKLLARELRKKSTLGEVLLWQRLNQRQRSGYDFHRQKPIDEYIVDFFAAELMLAVELDGGSHKLKGAEDECREKRLEALGVRFLRFSEKDVRKDPDAVAAAIDQWIAANGPKR